MGLLDAVQALIKAGFPDSTAVKIASGELPMDTASRMARASEQGFNPDDVFYHGTQANFTEFVPSEFGNVGPGVYVSRDPAVASSYANPKRSGLLEGAQVMPLLTRGETIIDKEYFRQFPNTRLSEMANLNETLRAKGITNIQEAPNAPDRAVFDPRDLRSYYSAAFDPDYTGPNILGLQGSTQKPSLLTAAANSATGGASLAVDQIPKGSNEDQLYQGLTDKMVDYLTAEMGGSEEDKQRAELISLGMDFLPVVGAAKGVSETFDAYKNDDTLGMALGAGGTLLGMIPFGRAAFKGVLGMVEDAPTVTRDTPLLQRVGDPDSVNQMKLEVEPGADLLPSQPISAADLEGRGFVSGMADTSRGDLSRVVAINDQPIDMVRFGGQDYMRQPSNVEQGILWASDAGQVTGLTNAARAAAELPGATRGPLYIPYQMGPQSTDFATMTADIMVPIAKQNLSKAKKKALDNRIRSGAGNKTADMKPLPDWPGIDSPKVDDYLANAGGDRKAVTKAIDEFRDDAGINLSQARAAIVDAEQMAPRVGNLRQAGVLDLARGPQPGRHPSYNTDLMGQYLGQFGEGANLLEDLTPLVRTTREPFVPLMLERGHDLSGAKLPAPVGKAMQPGLIGMFDTETIDQLIKKGLITP